MKRSISALAKPLLMAATVATLGLMSSQAFAGKTLDAIKQRGQLICGVNPSLPGFSAADSQDGAGW